MPPSLVVRIGGSIDDLKKALAEGKVVIENTSSSIDKLASKLEGASAIRAAEQWAAAINKIGDATKLTEADQKRANVVMERALAHYKALGKEAPPEIRKIADATKQVEKETGLLGTAFGKVGPAVLAAVSIGAISRAISSYTELTGKLTDLSAKTGIGVESLQKLGYAAKMNGADLETLTNGVTQLGRRLIGGETSTVGALKTLGLSLWDLQQMAPDEAFTKVADAIATIPNPMQQSELALRLFGKAGAELLPVMKGNLSETAAEAERLGLVLDEKAVAAGDRLGDTLDTLKLAGSTVIAQVLGPMVPGLTAVAQWFGHVASIIPFLQQQFSNLIAIGMKVISWMYDAAAAAVELAVRYGGPVARALGVNSEVAKGLRESSRWYADAASAQSAFSVAAGTVARVVKTQVPVLREAGDAAKRLKDLQDQMFGQTLIAKAQQYVKALGDVSNLTKLTGERKEELRKTIYEALEAYGLLGREAPAVLRQIADASLLPARSLSGMTALLAPAITGVRGLADAYGRLESRSLAGMALLPPAVKGITTVVSSSWHQIGTQISRTLETLRTAISGSFAQMMLGAKAVGEGMKDIWESIKGAAIQAFAGIADYFIRVALARMIAAVAGGRLGATMAAAVMGGGTSYAGTVAGTTGAAAGAGVTGGAGLSAAALAPYLGPAAGAAAGLLVGYYTGSKAKGAMAGAATGAAVGAYAGPVGMGVGAGVGALAGLVGAWLAKRKERKLDRQADEALGSLQAALIQQYGSLDAIRKIGDQVGISLAEAWGSKKREGLAQFTSLLEDFNEELTRNQTIQTGLQALGAGQFLGADLMRELTGGRLTDETRAVLGQFLSGQTAQAASGLAAVVQSGALVTMGGGALGGLGAGAAATWGQMEAQGASLMEIVAAMGPSITALQARFAETGATGGEAFDRIAALAAFAATEGVQPLTTAAAGVGSMLVGLYNTAQLDQGTFAGLANAILDTRNSLVDLGATGTTSAQALQPQLQQLWTIQHDLNYELDAGTQAMLDEAEAAGLIGAQFKDPAAKMTDAINALIDRMGIFINTLMGVPGAAAGASRGIDEAFKDKEVRVRVRWSPDGLEMPDGSSDSVPRLAAGGLITRPTFALVGEAGPEAVIPLDQLRRADGARASGDALNLTANFYGIQKERWVREEVMPAILAILRKGGGLLTDWQTTLGVG